MSLVGGFGSFSDEDLPALVAGEVDKSQFWTWGGGLRIRGKGWLHEGQREAAGQELGVFHFGGRVFGYPWKGLCKRQSLRVKN